MTVKLSDPEPKADQRNLFVDSEFGSTYTTTLAAGVTLTLSIDIENTQIGFDEMYNAAARVRVDTNNSAHDWPNGVSLTSAQRLVRMTGPYGNDQTSSEVSDGIRNYCVMLKNDDVSSHDYYIRIKFYHFRITPTLA